MEILNRLQFVHCDTLFSTSDEAKKYVENMQNIQRPTMYAEPMVLKYGDVVNPSIILAIGSVGNGKQDMTNKTYFIDLDSVHNNIAQISEILNATVEDVENIKEILTNIKSGCGLDEFGNYLTSKSSLLNGVKSLAEADEVIAEYLLAIEKKLTLSSVNTNTVETIVETTDNGTTVYSNVKLAQNIIQNNKNS